MCQQSRQSFLLSAIYHTSEKSVFWYSAFHFSKNTPHRTASLGLLIPACRVLFCSPQQSKWHRMFQTHCCVFDCWRFTTLQDIVSPRGNKTRYWNHPLSAESFYSIALSETNGHSRCSHTLFGILCLRLFKGILNWKMNPRDTCSVPELRI